MQRPDNQLQIRIKECENPTFGYRRGEDGEIEKDIFDGEPLPDGWVDSPARVDEVGIVRPALSFVARSAPILHGAAKDPDKGPGIDPGYDPYENHKFKALRAEYTRRTGKKVLLGVNKPELIEMLTELDTAE